MLSPTDRIELIQAALGQVRLDLRLENIILNLFTGQVQAGAIGIKHGRIVSLDGGSLPAEQVVDGGGRFALPGFIDTHVHLDSTLLTPAALAELIVPHGTTSMLADPMEIANVAGLQGLRALLDSAENLPYRVYVEVSSRVPTAPGLETTGGELGLEEVKQVLEWPQAVSLGELDPSKVLGLREEYLAKVSAAHALGKIANGHAAGLNPAELAAYTCGGLADDHECVDFADAAERLRNGLAVLVREGSTERNLEGILGGARGQPIDLTRLMFCTDDKHPDDIQREGHIDYMVRGAIKLGYSPLEAVRMATVNAARHFRMEGEIGLLAPGRLADILLVSRLEDVDIDEVYVGGKLVAKDGRLVETPPAARYPGWLLQTVKVQSGTKAQDFALKASGSQAQVWVIELDGAQIVNRRGKARLAVVDGVVQTDPANDILQLSVVERYGINGNIGTTFVRGFGMKNGAMASSVSHDHHNIVIAGADHADMAACVAAIQEMQGGLAIAAGGKVLERLALPVGGLLSLKSAGEVIEALGRLNAAYHGLGGGLPAPFMSLSFISLPTVPELGLTDKGLVDVRAHELISPFAG
jgi:adenine deaminase